MVEQQIRRRGISDERVLSAIAACPRHLFVPRAARDSAYEDTPLPIGGGQTISQPYIVALMTSSLALRGMESVLEVGTGSGYQAALLSMLSRAVYTVELQSQLAGRASRALRHLRCANVVVHVGDGSLGWLEHAPYDAIIVTAAAPAIPAPLIAQLADHGRMAVPVATGDGYQLLKLIRKEEERIVEQVLASVAFVPLRGKFGIH